MLGWTGKLGTSSQLAYARHPSSLSGCFREVISATRFMKVNTRLE